MASRSKKELARGVALVEKVIERIESRGGKLAGAAKTHRAKGMSEGAIAKLRIKNQTLPPSLARFLAYDEAYLGILDKKGRLRGQSFREMMEDEFDEETAEQYAYFEPLLPGECFVLPGGADSRRFLYAGEPDALGEFPILLVDTDDVPFVCLQYPGFDVYLADMFDAIELENEEYAGLFDDKRLRASMIDQARRNFGGFKFIDTGGLVEHVNGAAAATKALAALER